MKQDNKSMRATELRRLAEQRLEERKAKAGAAPQDQLRLRHELEVHQIELEMQNEELRVARIATEASLERYTMLFDFAPVGYALLNPEGTIREINHTGAELLGRDRSKLIAVRFEALVEPRDRLSVAAFLERARLGESKEICEVELQRGRVAPVQVRLTARAETLAERMILLAFEDVTDQKERERQLARTEQALRDVDRRKDEFLAVLSHELRNPLAPIRNCLFLLDHAEASGDSARKARAIIDRQLSLLTRLVNDLLDVTRIARGKIELQRERVELGVLVRRTMDDHRLSFEASGIRLDGRMASGPLWANADAARLVQALSNLLGNAEKFTPRGGTVEVSLARVDDGHLTLSVRDTGAGIDPEMLPHVFESFVQAPQTMARSRGGLGLGLAMVKGLVELHGGTVSVESEGLGRGTEVTVRLPADALPARAVSETPEPRPAHSRRVLVIDDNADNSDSMRFGLQMSGHDVEVAYDGAMALELARTFHPEVVVSDIGLPGMDGYAVARAFRAEATFNGIYLIAVSGYTRPEDFKRSAEAGFDRHMGKPVPLEDLEQLISEAPGRRAALRNDRPQ